MKVSVETANLRDGACVVSIGAYDLEKVRALSDPHLMALAAYAVENWKFRPAVASSAKKGPNGKAMAQSGKGNYSHLIFKHHGKSYSFEQIVQMMHDAPSHDSGPSKGDKENAVAKCEVWRVEARQEHPDATNADLAIAVRIKMEERAEEIRSTIMPALEWEWDESNADPVYNASRLQQAARLYKKPTI